MRLREEQFGREAVDGREAAMVLVRKCHQWDKEHRDAIIAARGQTGATREPGEHYDLSVDRLMQFLMSWGHDNVADMLLAVEEAALYSCEFNPSPQEIRTLWYVRELAKQVRAIGAAHQRAQANLLENKRPTRFSERPEKKEDDLIQFCTNHDWDMVMFGLRNAESRATLWQTGGMHMISDYQQAALLCINQFTERLDLVRYNYENDTPRALVAHRSRAKA